MNGETDCPRLPEGVKALLVVEIERLPSSEGGLRSGVVCEGVIDLGMLPEGERFPCGGGFWSFPTYEGEGVLVGSPANPVGIWVDGGGNVRRADAPLAFLQESNAYLRPLPGGSLSLLAVGPKAHAFADVTELWAIARRHMDAALRLAACSTN